MNGITQLRIDAHSRKEPCKSVQKGTACLAFNCNSSRVPLAFTRHRMHILGAHVRHTPRAQSLLPARLPSPFFSSALSITIGVSPPPSPARPPLRVLSVFQPALYQFKVRTLDPSPCKSNYFPLRYLVSRAKSNRKDRARAV